MTLLGSWMEFRFQLNAWTSVLSRTRSNVVMTVILVNNVFGYGPDGKEFFAAVNFPGGWADGALTARFLHIIKNKLVSTRSVWIRAFPGAEKRMERSLALSPKGLPDA